MAKSQCCWQSPEQWREWSQWLAAGLHGRNRWRLPVLLTGMLLASGRRTVTTWLRAAGVSDDYQDYYYFLAGVGRKSESIASHLVALVLARLPLPARVLLVIDDSPTKRYGPKVEGADVHHNPTPGPADQPFLYGHVWVTISLALRHPQWGALAFPLRAMLYVRKQTIASIPHKRRWPRFATKLQLAGRLVEWIVPLLKKAGKTVWIVVDGGYTKRPLLRRALKTGVTIVGRLRKDAHLRDVPPKLKKGQRRRRGRPRKYGRNRLSLAKRAGQKRGRQRVTCTVYGETVVKIYKTFLATYPPAGGVIRVVLVKEDHGWYAFYCTDANASVGDILEAFADRATIEQDFHDVKEVWGARAAAGAQHLDQPGGVQSQPLDAYAGGTVGLESARRTTGRPQRLALGRRAPPSFARQPPQGPEAADHAKRIIDDHHVVVAPQKNHATGRKPDGPRRVTSQGSRKVQSFN